MIKEYSRSAITYNELIDDIFKVKANRRINENEELFLNYKKGESDSFYFSNYGFVTSKNLNNSVRFTSDEISSIIQNKVSYVE